MKINELPSQQMAKILEHVAGHPHSYGFSIVEAMGISMGSVYVQLQKLEESGLIVSEKPDHSSGTRSGCRVTYTLSPKGHKVFKVVKYIWKVDLEE